MTETEIEKAAEEVLLAHDMGSVPIDPFEIARLEGIKLLPGSYDGCFDGRIEYRGSRERGGFYLFYAEAEPAHRPEGRVRFSVAHELAHFYLPHHREYLLSGVWHGSRAGFVSDKPLEREADQFAASLLLPRRPFIERVEQKNFSCTLPELVRFADELFKTSVLSTVIRYVQLDVESCCVVVSRQGRVAFSLRSEEMRRQGLGWIDRDSPVPASSITGRVLKGASGSKRPVHEGAVDADVWFDAGRVASLWEEVMILGQTGLTLTFLVATEESEEEEEDEE